MIYYTDSHFANYGGHIYRLLYSQSDIIDDDPIGMFREENGKVFMRELENMTPTQEYLIYDWNLNIGDVVYVQPEEHETGLVLDAITDTIINEVERKVFHLHYEADADLSEIWIEGMGSELGFPFSGTKDNPISFNFLPMTTELLCYYEDGELAWDNPDYDECVMGSIVDNPELYNDNSLSVYPNPCHDVIHIILDDKNNNIFIYDNQGVMVSQFKNIVGSSFDIDMSDCQEGLYLLKLVNDSNVITFRIIKY